MPRAKRVLDPTGGVYHVTCRGNDRQQVFFDDEDRSIYCWLLKEIKERTSFLLFHYCLMDNHVHLLISPSNNATLSEIMKSINQRYTWHFKKKYGHVGHLWQQRFWSRLIEDDAYLLVCGLYIELNPVRAGLAADPAGHVWSSYRAYSEGAENALVDTDPLYASLGRVPGGAMAAYRQLAIGQVSDT